MTLASLSARAAALERDIDLARGPERDREAAARLRVLLRQADVDASRRSVRGERHDRGRVARRLCGQGARARVPEARGTGVPAAGPAVRPDAAPARRARRARRAHGQGPLAHVRAGSRVGRVRELGARRARERVREGERRLEDPEPAPLHDDVHAVRGRVGQDGLAESRAVRRAAAGSAAERRVRSVPGARSSCRSTTRIP